MSFSLSLCIRFGFFYNGTLPFLSILVCLFRVIFHTSHAFVRFLVWVCVLGFSRMGYSCTCSYDICTRRRYQCHMKIRLPSSSNLAIGANAKQPLSFHLCRLFFFSAFRPSWGVQAPNLSSCLVRGFPRAFSWVCVQEPSRDEVYYWASACRRPPYVLFEL